MTPQERQLVDELFDRLSQVESAPRDPDASSAIAQGLRKAPNAVYALVQTVLLQDEALKRANHRIQELEQAQAGEQNQSGGFLDSMRDTILGQNQSRGSVPNVPPPVPNRPVWNSGQVLQQSQSPGHYDQGPYDQGPYGQGSYGQGYGQGPSGQPYGASQSPFGGGGGSFLGTAAAAAAGMVGGSLLLNSIRSMMGGHRYGVADAGATADRSSNPQSDQSDSALARDAGINDIGSSGHRGDSDDGARAGLFDQASNDDDDTDHDSDGFDGDDGDSDYA
ncbi:DUF2076 domain-containing protein [Bradyrhizobium sp.]|jgi:hypothetical protein|uniref:DUF2076 domain-containing protein n=1 Tax=Bradyrhizobium sp. TaxID=376 RepID=UPI003BAFD040